MDGSEVGLACATLKPMNFFELYITRWDCGIKPSK